MTAAAARAGLVQAILEHPDDDELRGIFADYLEDHDEAEYARFIRTQLVLAKLPRYDPVSLGAWFRDRNSVTGYQMDRYVPDIPTGFTWRHDKFHRGFASRVELRDRSEAGFEHFATTSKLLYSLAPVQTLEICSSYDAPPPKLTALTEAPTLSQLRTLRFRLGRLPAEEIQRLQDSPHAANVTALDFSFGGIAPAGLGSLLQPPLLAQLQELTLHSNSLGFVLNEAILGAGGSHRLRKLVLSETNTTAFQSYSFFNAPLMQTVVELDLTCHPLGATGFAALAGSRLARNLESLVLVKTAPGVPGIRALVAGSGFTRLKHLNLMNNRLGPVAARLIAQSPQFAGLHSLELRDNPIKDTGLSALIEAPFFKNLVQLELNGCDISDAGLQMLLEAPVPPGLVQFNFVDATSGRQSQKLRDRVRARFLPAKV